MPTHNDHPKRSDTPQHHPTDRPSIDRPSASARRPSISHNQLEPAPNYPTPPINHRIPHLSQPHHASTPVPLSRAPYADYAQQLHPPPRQHSHDERHARFADGVPSPPHTIRPPTPVRVNPVLPTVQPPPPVWGPSMVVMGRRSPSPMRVHLAPPRTGRPFIYVSSPRSSSSGSSRSSSPIRMPIPDISPPSYHARFGPYRNKYPSVSGAEKPPRRPTAGDTQESANREPLPQTISDILDDIHKFLVFDLPLLYHGRFRQVFDHAEFYITTLIKTRCPYSDTDLKYLEELRKNVVWVWQGCVEALLNDWETLNVVTVLLLGSVVLKSF